MSEDRPLAGNTALVTGASRGLGREIAHRLHAAGAKLHLVARDVNGLKSLAEKLGDGAEIHAADLADQGQLDAMLDRLADGEIQIVVNNAAVQGPIGELDRVDFTAWKTVFQVNFFAPVRICQMLIGPMRKLGWGKIINISGGGATTPRPHVSAYGASKCALVRFSETLAEELNATGIDVNCVSPGAMNTHMLDEVLAGGPSGAAREYEKAVAQKKSGGTPPKKAADLVAFLASPASDGITGRLISAVWDNWADLPRHRDELKDIYTLRRIVPEDRGQKW